MVAEALILAVGFIGGCMVLVWGVTEVAKAMLHTNAGYQDDGGEVDPHEAQMG